MRKAVLFLLLAFLMLGCSKEGEIVVSFRVPNPTNGDMTVTFSSWGNFSVNHDSHYLTPHDFHNTETYSKGCGMSMFMRVKDDDYEGIPPTVIPAWNYINSIVCNKVIVPDEYFKNPANWRVNRGGDFLSGPVIIAELILTTDLLIEFNRQPIVVE